MKDKVHRFILNLLLLGNIILCIAIFYIIYKNKNHLQSSNFMVFVIYQIFNIIIYGLSIEKLHRQAHTDELTGLYNRKFLNDKLCKIKAKRLIALILIDIDNFKNINDSYGHIVGDQVLQQFAEILQCSTRKKDIIARWGGDEFVIILPDTNIEDACKVGERIRLKVEKTIFSNEGYSCNIKLSNITVSIGIAPININVKTNKNIKIEQFIRITDEALYKAKEKKNQIITVPLVSGKAFSQINQL